MNQNPDWLLILSSQFKKQKISSSIDSIIFTNMLSLKSPCQGYIFSIFKSVITDHRHHPLDNVPSPTADAATYTRSNLLQVSVPLNTVDINLDVMMMYKSFKFISSRAIYNVLIDDNYGNYAALYTFLVMNFLSFPFISSALALCLLLSFAP